MALEAMPLAATPLEALSREATDEQQQRQSPVDVVVDILKDLAEFRRTSSKQALREAMREACKAALLRTAVPIDIDPVVEYLRDRGVIPPAPSRASRIKTSTASNSAEVNHPVLKGRRPNRRWFP
jgi:hypothetical protein